MPFASQARVEVGTPPTDLQRPALQLAFQAIALPQRDTLVEQTLAAEGQQSLDGLVAAWHANTVLAAMWCESQPGDSAAVWPPQTIDGVSPSLADDVLHFAIDWLATQGTEMVQALLFTDADRDADRFGRAGFDNCCDLLYLASSRPSFPTAPPGNRLTFRPIELAHLDELARLVETTYEHTLDCPALNGRRDCGQVIAGYRSACRDNLRNWFTVEQNGKAVGCLLLGNRAGKPSWELIYMGLVPDARGRGWGIEIVRHAQWMVREQGGEHLLLAVDAANSPALRLYAAAGFVTWDRRSVFVRFLPRLATKA